MKNSVNATSLTGSLLERIFRELFLFFGPKMRGAPSDTKQDVSYFQRLKRR